LKTQLHAVNACVKRSSQRSLNETWNWHLIWSKLQKLNKNIIFPFWKVSVTRDLLLLFMMKNREIESLKLINSERKIFKSYFFHSRRKQIPSGINFFYILKVLFFFSQKVFFQNTTLPIKTRIKMFSFFSHQKFFTFKKYFYWRARWKSLKNNFH